MAVLLIASTWPAYRDFRSADEQSLLTPNRKRIDTFFASGDGDASASKVVAVGTSLLHRGTFLDKVMENLDGGLGQPGFRFLRVAAAGAGFHHYRFLVDEIIRRRPDVLLLQVDICYGHSQTNRYTDFLQGQLELVWNKFMKQTRGQRYKPSKSALRNRVDDIFGVATKDLDPVKLQKYDRYRVVLQGQRNEGFANSRDIRLLLERAAASGVKVAFLIMPRSPAAEEVKDELFRPMEEAFLSDLQALYGVEVVRCPLAFRQEEFYDYGHFNDDGRSRFAPWLATFIRQDLIAGGKL